MAKRVNNLVVLIFRLRGVEQLILISSDTSDGFVTGVTVNKFTNSVP